MPFNWHLVVLLLISSIHFSIGWDNDDFEIFDLVEEVKENFYTFMGLEKDASSADIRKAYRKLSLVLHPDKNDAPDAENTFRKLVAVYDVLKDEGKRQKYDLVLQNGLPDWRQPIFYYRKYRKMGLAEFSIFIFGIASIGHFLFIWAAYLEKRFELEELLEPARKRLEKKKAKGKAVDDAELSTDNVLAEHYGYKRPTFWDVLPFVLYRFGKGTILSIPSTFFRLKSMLHDWFERRKVDEGAEVADDSTQEKIVRPKRRPQAKIRDASEFDDNWQSNALANDDAAVSDETFPSSTIKDSVWTNDDYAALARAMAKFPGGTPARWERIAHELGRLSEEVTKKVKEMKVSLAKQSVSPGLDVVSGKKKSAVNLSDSLITKSIDRELGKTTIITDAMLYQSQDDIPDDYDQGTCANDDEELPEIYSQVKKRKVKTRPAEEKSDASADVVEKPADTSQACSPTRASSCEVSAEAEQEKPQSWTQVQQKCLEKAIAQFPKSTQDRWTCIARAVPGKSKEECMARYKLLVEHIKQKKSALEKES